MRRAGKVALMTLRSTKGDVIASDAGGVPQQPGVLDYEYSPMRITPDEVNDVKSMTIDYTEPDVPVDRARTERRKKGWE
jgi:hypothetical protein